MTAGQAIVTSGQSTRDRRLPGVLLILTAVTGVVDAVARKLAVPDMTTTVLTMTLTGLGADLRTVVRDGRGAAGRAARATLGRRLLVVATMLAGAITGASLALDVSPVSALGLAAGLLTVAFGGAVAAARPR